jgi:hypothetical protein
MPNGDDATWVRVCASIDGFRTRYGRWPTRVRLFAGALENLRDHVLTPAGFEVVLGIVQLVVDVPIKTLKSIWKQAQLPEVD